MARRNDAEARQIVADEASLGARIEKKISGVVPVARLSERALGQLNSAETVWREAREERTPFFRNWADTAHPHSHAVGVALMLAAAVLWSTSGIGIRSVHLPALSLAGWRGLFALPVLSLQLMAFVRSAGTAASAPMRSRWPWIGVLAYVAMSIATVAATQLTTVASAMFIRYTSPIYVALLSWPLLRERVTWRHWVACGGTIVGILFVFRDSISPHARLGNALAVFASFAAAALPLALRADQRLLSRRGMPGAARVSPALVITVGNAVGVLVCLPAMIASPPQHLSEWAILAALGVGQVGLAYWCFAMAVPRLTALETSLVPAIEPVLNPIWVLFAMGERPGPQSIAGAALILLSVLFPGLKRRS